jgi:hypothetical protein
MAIRQMAHPDGESMAVARTAKVAGTVIDRVDRDGRAGARRNSRLAQAPVVSSSMYSDIIPYLQVPMVPAWRLDD